MAVPGFEPLSPRLSLSWLLILWDSVVPLFIGFSSLNLLSYFFSFFFFLNPLHLFFALLFLVLSYSGGGARLPADSIAGIFWLPLLLPPCGPPAICATDQGVLLLLCLLKSMQASVPRSHGKVEVGNEGIQGLHGVTWKEGRAWRLSDSPHPSTHVTTAIKLLNL